MTFIYRLITLIAALVIILLTLNVLAVKYEIGPGFDFWSPDASSDERYAYYYEESEIEAGVPVSADGNVSVPTNAFDDIALRHPTRSNWLVFPVVYGGETGGHRFGRYFHRSGSAMGEDGAFAEFFEAGGECGLNVVNIVVINQQTGKTLAAFDERVLIPRYYFYGEQGRQTIAALVITEDTNGDEKLDCGDRAEFRVVGLNYERNESVDVGINPANIYSDRFRLRDRELIVTELVELDGVKHIKITTIDRDTLEISERKISDFVTDAQTAFENVAVK